MKRRPKIKTKFVIWEEGNYKEVPRDAEVRRWIYHNGKRRTQYHVDEISETGEIQNTYIYKYTTEGPIFRRQTYSKWKEEIKQARARQKELFPSHDRMLYMVISVIAFTSLGTILFVSLWLVLFLLSILNMFVS